MPGFDAQFCKMVEVEYITIKKTIELVLVYPEQLADKIKSYCFRVANILFKGVLDEIAFWQEQIMELQNIILNSKFFKNTKRICNDMMRCQKLYELIANKPWFGNKTEAELRADKEKFEQYVCNGQLIKAATQLLNTYTTTASAFVTSVKTAMNMWVSVQLNTFIAFYTGRLKASGIPTLLEKLDTIAECIFGVCAIGATAVNYKNDIANRLYITPNGTVDRSRFQAILTGGIAKIDDGIEYLENLAIAPQNEWRKIAKNKLSTPKEWVGNKLA